jgi:putative molybdopterin biosynthesis protein
MAREQEQFLNVVNRDTAERLWREAIRPKALPAEPVSLAEALGRVLADDVMAGVDVPAFDRSNVDGYALRAEETYGAAEESPRRLLLNAEELATGVVPQHSVESGTATPIATGGMLPRGADAVLMVEHTRLDGDELVLIRPVAPGSHVSFAGTDVARGELVLRRGTLLTARETGLLAAIGADVVSVVRPPRVAILSTGDEVIAPGTPPRPGSVYDANATLLADAVRELGGEPRLLGIVGDDEDALEAALERGLASADVVLLSGGTSKGAGDLSYRALERRSPGIVVHGVALKPGKPICLGAVGTTPVAILPGFPTSAIFTFHEFVAPILREMGALDPQSRSVVDATLAMRCNSERGRTEYLLVGLVPGANGVSAYPMGKGSGSVTTFSRADGFIVIPRTQEYVECGERVTVTLLGRGIVAADLVAIGSHCVGLDLLLGLVADRGFRSKTLWVGSQGGLDAAARGECDVAGIHLLDPATKTYNAPFLPPTVRLVRGYGRLQGLVHRRGDPRFEGRSVAEAIDEACENRSTLMVSRNRGSGTRVLLDGLLKGRRPPGSAVEVRSHNAVAASVAQGRADWGVAIAPVAEAYGLAFVPIQAEHYDFAIPADRWDRPAVSAFRILLKEIETRRRLAELGFDVESAGEV